MRGAICINNFNQSISYHAHILLARAWSHIDLQNSIIICLHMTVIDIKKPFRNFGTYYTLAHIYLRTVQFSLVNGDNNCMALACLK